MGLAGQNGRTVGETHQEAPDENRLPPSHRVQMASRNMEYYILIIIILLCYRDGENREDFVAQ